jgi:hypothetical protein
MMSQPGKPKDVRELGMERSDESTAAYWCAGRTGKHNCRYCTKTLIYERNRATTG